MADVIELERVCRQLAAALRLSNKYALAFARQKVGDDMAPKMFFNLKAEEALFEAAKLMPNERI
jgi:hypothetical protein